MATNQDEIQRMMNESTLLVSDAASMFRYPVTKNMKPYDKAAVESNNKLVDEWYEKVLKGVAINSKIAAGKVGPCWSTFYEGRSIWNLYPVLKMLPRATGEQLRWWLDFFAGSSVEELTEAGITMVSMGWALIMNELRLHFCEEKMKKVYSSTDPLEWDKASNREKQLMEGKPMPFWDEDSFRDIQEKVMTVLNKRVVPRMT